MLDYRESTRHKDYAFYVKELGSLPGFEFVSEPDGFFSNRWLSTVLIDTENTRITTTQLREALEKENIETEPLWKPMHLQPIFKETHIMGRNVPRVI